MTDNELAQRAARDYLNNIESCLTWLSRMVEQTRDNLDIVIDRDIAVLDRVRYKLACTEYAWGKSNRLFDNMQRDADAADERDTYGDAFGPAVQ